MRRAGCLVVLLTTACRSPVPSPTSAGEPPSVPTPRVEPEAPDGMLRPVSRIAWDGVPVDPTELWLFSGELSAYHERKLRMRDVPASLLERRLPALAWQGAGELVLAPALTLPAGERVSVAAPGFGLLATFGVLEAQPPFARVWPPLSTGGAPDYWLFCGAGAAPAVDAERFLEPGHHRVLALSGAAPDVGADRCVRLVSPSAIETSGPWVPPLDAGVELAPDALERGLAVAGAPPVCAADELAIGPGCLRVEDDRGIVEGPADPTLWLVSAPANATVALAPKGRFVFRGLTPSNTELVRFRVRNLEREVFQGDVPVVTTSLRPHVVLNEVYANPNGPEPKAEWVELYNDGSASVELEGFRLRDAGGETVLPSFALAPGAFVLVVREDYDPDSGLDIAPLPGTPLLRVPSLGKSGLSNSGEPLVLESADGAASSAFPPSPKPKAGISVARCVPWALDDDPASFARHRTPGASPGGSNACED